MNLRSTKAAAAEQSDRPKPSAAAKILGLVAVAPAAYYGGNFAGRLFGTGISTASLGKRNLGMTIPRDTKSVIDYMKKRYGLKTKVYPNKGPSPAFVSLPFPGLDSSLDKKMIKRIKKQGYGLGVNLGGYKSPAMAAHELGHAANARHIRGFSSASTAKQVRKIWRALVFGTPAWRMASVGTGAVLSIDPEKRKYVPLAIAAGWAPTIIEELRASDKGIRAIFKTLGLRKTIKAVKQLGLAFGSYGLQPVAATAIALAGGKIIGDRFVRRGTEKSAGPLISISWEHWKKRKERQKMLKSMAGPKIAGILAKLSIAKKQPTLRDVVESQMHSAWTTLFDNLHAQGYMGTKERISYSGAISKFLNKLKLKRNFKIKAEDVPFLTKTALDEKRRVYAEALSVLKPRSV